MDLTNQDLTITLEDGSTAPVKIKHGEIIVNWGLFKEGFTVESLTHLERTGKLPTWARQLPILMQAIAERFEDERKNGLNPHERIGFSDGEIRVTDMVSGTTITGRIAALKKRFDETGTLPRAFNSKKCRQLMGLPTSTERRNV